MAPTNRKGRLSKFDQQIDRRFKGESTPQKQAIRSSEVNVNLQRGGKQYPQGNSRLPSTG